MPCGCDFGKKTRRTHDELDRLYAGAAGALPDEIKSESDVNDSILTSRRNRNACAACPAHAALTGRIPMPNLLSLFSNRPISVKLATMTVVGAICMALVATAVLVVARNQLILERTEKAQAVVDAAWNMADSFQKEAAAGKMTEEEAKARFYAAAGAVWYEGHTNYLFIYDTETGISVVNPG